MANAGPTKVNAVPQRPTKPNTGPTKANEGQQRLTMANKGQRRPNVGQRRPTKTNEDQRRSTQTQRRPTQAHNIPRQPTKATQAHPIADEMHVRTIVRAFPLLFYLAGTSGHGSPNSRPSPVPWGTRTCYPDGVPQPVLLPIHCKYSDTLANGYFMSRRHKC
jgi:hypothetical protein